MASIFPRTTAPAPKHQAGVPVLQRGKLRLREAKRLARSARWRAAALGQDTDRSPTNGIPDSKEPYFRAAEGTLSACWALSLPVSHRTSISRASGPGEVDQSWRGPARRRPASVSPSRRPIMVPSGPRRPQPQPQPLLRALEPRELQAADPRPFRINAKQPPLTSQAAKRRPADGCACAPRRSPAPPPAATLARKEVAPFGFHSAQARQLSRRAWGEVT